MDYFSKSLPRITEYGAELRKSPRKAIRLPTLIGTAHNGIIKGHSIDLSEGGLSVMLPVQLAETTLCSVRFDLAAAGGKSLSIIGAGSVIYCSCSGMEGFRIGMKFRVKDSHAQVAISQFLAQRIT